jgi:transposase-like protein
MQGDKADLLTRMAVQESEVLILHEVGEAMAEPMLGSVWREMLLSFTSRRTIFLSRSVRDNLADCLSTLPELIKRKQTCSLHFYFANLDGLRRTLFPQLVLAYEHWRDSGDTSKLLVAVEAGRKHWQVSANKILNTWQSNPQEAQALIDTWVDENGPLVL